MLLLKQYLGLVSSFWKFLFMSWSLYCCCLLKDKAFSGPPEFFFIQVLILLLIAVLRKLKCS